MSLASAPPANSVSVTPQVWQPPPGLITDADSKWTEMGDVDDANATMVYVF